MLRRNGIRPLSGSGSGSIYVQEAIYNHNIINFKRPRISFAVGKVGSDTEPKELGSGSRISLDYPLQYFAFLNHGRTPSCHATSSWTKCKPKNFVTRKISFKAE